MQRRVMISGIPYWIGIYDEGPEKCYAVGEVRGHRISIVASNQIIAMKRWVVEAETLLCRPR
jgi:hypothetical protein